MTDSGSDPKILLIFEIIQQISTKQRKNVTIGTNDPELAEEVARDELFGDDNNLEQKSSSKGLKKNKLKLPSNFGTVVVLGDERLSLVIKNQAWSYIISNKVIQKYPNNGPIYVNTSEELLPASMTGSLTFDYQKHYFFRGNRFCLRDIEVSQGSLHYEEEESIEIYERDEFGNTKIVSKQRLESTVETYIDETSMCVWKDNSRLFGCLTTKDKRLTALCNDSTVFGVLGYSDNIYIFTPLKVYIFDGQYSAMFPFGKLITDDFQPQLRWKQFDPSEGGYFVWNNLLYSIRDNQYFTSWDSKGDIVKSNERIFDADDCLNMNGATVLLPNNRIAIIIKHLVSYYIKKGNKIFKESDNNIVLVEKSVEKFPHSITASYTRDFKMYYFFRGSEYCYRKLILEKQEMREQFEQYSYQEVYSVDSNGNSKLVNQTIDTESLDTFKYKSRKRRDVSMCVWKKTNELFGCSSKVEDSLKVLCSKASVTGIASVDSEIYIFNSDTMYAFDGKGINIRTPFGKIKSNPIKASEKWNGFNSKENGFLIIEGQMHTIFPNETYRSWKPDGSSIDEFNRVYTEEKYKLVSKLTPSTTEEPLHKRISSDYAGTAVVLPNSRIAVIFKEQVWYYRIKGKKIIKDSEDNGPKTVTETIEEFPPFITAALTFDYEIYYFFRANQYCVRPLIVDNNVEAEEVEWQEAYEVDQNGNVVKMLNRSETSKHFNITEKESHCIWRENKELFGCEKAEKYPELCENPITIGTILYEKINVYFFVKNKVYVFNTQIDIKSGEKPSISKYFDLKFIDMTSNSVNPSEKWVGFNPESSPFFAKDNELCSISDNKRFSCWDSEGKKVAINQKIEDAEPAYADEADGKEADSGALISAVENDGKFMKIKDNKIFDIIIEGGKLVFTGKFKVVDEDEHKNPQNVKEDQHIIAAIKSKSNSWYFVNDNGKYCKRPDKSFVKCKEWFDNEIVFGCKVKGILSELTQLCDNPKISAGGNYPPYIYVFRGGKFWQFDSNQKKNKPFGNLIEGGILARTRWPGIRFPGAVGYNEDKLIIIYENKWSQWKPNGEKDVFEDSLKEKKVEYPDQPEGSDVDSGALISIDGKGKYLKVHRNKVCYVTVVDNKCFWSGSCVSVKEDKNRLPPNIIAAIKSRNKNWYFINSKGKYCKRPVDENSECKEWNNNEELFGCKEDNVKSELEFLCKNPNITSGANNPPFIYVFRGGKYWKFNNKPKPNKPFGDLVEGAKLAKNKWPDIHFPGGVGHENSKLIMIYNTKWSRWRPSAGSPNVQPTDEGDLDNEVEPTKTKYKDLPPDMIPVDEDESASNEIIPIDGDIVEILDQTIREPEVLDEPSDDVEDEGAVIPHAHDAKESKYTKIKDNIVCNYVFKGQKLYLVGKCVAVDEDENNYPSGIVAAIKSVDKDWYFFNKEGKHCRRAEDSNEKCTEWENNRDVFGCNIKTLHPEMESLCDNVTINAGGNYPPFILVFRGGKYWQFDNQPEAGKPFGNLVIGATPARNKWFGIHFPGGIGYDGEYLVMIYDKTWSQWYPNGDIDYEDERIVEVEETTGTAVVLPDNRIAVVVKDQVWFYKKKGNKVFKESEDFGPKPVNTTVENFPPLMSAAISLNHYIYYFFRGSQYCKRPITVDEYTHKDVTREDWNESFERNGVSYRISLNKSESMKYFRFESEDHCVWRDNSELFGCQSSYIPKKLRDLCANPISTGAIIYDKTNIYLFTSDRVYVFNTRTDSKHKQLPENIDPIFSDLKPDRIEPSKKWIGFKPNYGRFFAVKNELCVIIDNIKYSCWDSDGKQITKDEPIGEPEKETPDEEDGDAKDGGALINSQDNDGKYAFITGNKAYILVFEDKKLYIRGKYSTVDKDEHNYPSDIIAAIKTPDLLWYYIRKEGKYCKRQDKVYEKCNVWKDNKKLFGCNAISVGTALKSLCNNPNVIAGGNYETFIYLFRNGKYWKFDNRPKRQKPIGNLVEGSVLAKDVFPKIHLPGGVGNNGDMFIVINGQKWSEWTFDKKNVIDNEDIGVKKDETPVDNEDDSGALILVDEENGRYAKVHRNRVCYLIIRNNKPFWTGKCLNVREDVHNFPPDIIAAIKAKDNNWYYFKDSGNYCKRPDNDNSECEQWEKNDEVFDCKDKGSNEELKSLCENPDISSGTNYPPFIYVFRNGKYWKLDNKPKPSKPFGEVIEYKQANRKWKGIHFPGGAGYEKSNLIMVYKKEWLRWGPSDGQDDEPSDGEHPSGSTDEYGQPITDKYSKPRPSRKPNNGTSGETPEKETSGVLSPSKIRDESGQPKTDESGQPITDGSNQLTTDESGQPITDGSDQLTTDESGQPKTDESGQPITDGSNQLTTDESGQPITDGSDQLTTDESGQPITDGSDQLTTDESGQPFTDGSDQLTTDESGQPITDGSDQLTTDESGQPITDGSDQLTTDESGQPITDGSDQLTTDESGQPITDGSDQLTIDESGQPITDGSGQPITDKYGKPRPSRKPKNGTSGETPEEETSGVLSPSKIRDESGQPITDGSGQPITDKYGKPRPSRKPKPGTNDETPEEETTEETSDGTSDGVESSEEPEKSGDKPSDESSDGENPSDGNRIDIEKEPIREVVIPDEPNGDDKDEGALINDDDNDGKYSKIKDNKVCSYVIKDSKLYTSGECVSVKEDEHKYPPNIIAAIKPKDDNWYFINKEGKYCERKDKEYKECTVWKDNRELFGCKSKPIKLQLESLCDNPIINAGGNNPPFIDVFRGGKYWIFDNKPKKNKPFGDLMTGTLPAKNKWPEIHFPGGIGHNKDKPIAVYDKTWSQWSPIGDIEVNEEPIIEVEDSPGTAVVLPNNRIAIVVKDQVWYFMRTKDKKITKGSKDFGPKPVNMTKESFPPSISASVTLGRYIYYFFRGSKYCKRPLVIEDDTIEEITSDEWNGDEEKALNARIFSRQEASQYFSSSKSEFYCIWRDTTELFGCDIEEKSENLEQLCTSPLTIGNILYDRINIYYFKKDKVYVFDTRTGAKSGFKPTNDQNSDPKFSDLRPETIIAREKWVGFEPNYGRFFAVKNELCVIKDNIKYSCWDADGKQTAKDEPIGEFEEEAPDEPDGNDKDSGALLNIDEYNGKYVKIKGDKVCYLIVEMNKLYLIDKCNQVTQDDNSYPPNVIAAIKTDTDNWFFVDKQGKYCKRQDKITDECKVWKDNKELFGCETKDNSPELKSLCDNPKISAGGNYPPFIYVFRGGKYWQFDNKPKRKKPLGALVEGSIPAKIKWPGIHFPGGVGNNMENMIVAYDDKWSQWLPNGKKDVDEEPIEQKVFEIPDEPEGSDSNSGALVPTDEKTPKYAKISKNTVCYIIVKKNRCFWSGKCKSITKDDNKFPPNIIAAVKPKDNNWYFFNEDSKYCKRPDNSKTECKQWKHNKEVFGCNAKDVKPKLKFLCDNPRITAGANYPPYIYVFRGGKYWQFDNEPKNSKPFGDLVDGGIPANTKWPGIHFPGGAGFQNENFIMIYKNKWSRWRPDKDMEKPDKEDTDGEEGVKPGDGAKEPDNVHTEGQPEAEESSSPAGVGKGNKPTKDKTKGSTKPGKGSKPVESDEEEEKPSDGQTEDKTEEGSEGGSAPASVEDSGSKSTKGKPKGSDSKGNKAESDINDIKDEPIRDEETPDEPNGDDRDSGALINNNDGMKTKIHANKVCIIIVKNNKMYLNGKCVPIEKDKHKYPPNIVAAIKPKDKNWYFINKNGKYCKRKDKNYKKCTKWKDNKELFGCNAKSKKGGLDSLCENPKINAGGNYPPFINVFRGGKLWKFNNKPEKKKPFGNLVEGGIPAKQKWPGIHFPGAFGNNKNKPIMVYNNTWSQWLPNGDNDVDEEPITNLENSPGTAVLLPNNRIAVVIKNKVWYYRKKGKKILKDSDDYGPKPVKDTVETFPPYISAALTIDYNIYYFFKGTKFCKRPLFVHKDTTLQDENDIDSDQNDLKDTSKYFKYSPKESHCIWRENKELFNCQSQKVNKKLKNLCSFPITIGSIIYDKKNIYIFSIGKLFIFDSQADKKHKTEPLKNKKGEPNFNHLISDNIEPSKKWKGFDPNYGRFFAKTNDLCVITDNKYYSCWGTDGREYINDAPIGEPEEEIPDEHDVDDGNAGALINPDDNEGKFARIKGNKVCNLSIEFEKLYFIGECVDVTQDIHKYPPNIIAAIKPKDNNWYFLDKKDKYCKRRNKSYKECTKWNDNKNLFGCKAKPIKPELESLCKNTTVTAGGNYPPYIFVFRGGKYWRFNNKPKPNKPLGDLVEGGILAKNKWPGIHFPGGFGSDNEKFMMIYKNTWSRWLPNGFNDIVDEPIVEKEQEIPDLPEKNDIDSGALIPMNESIGKYAKISQNKVCYVVIKKNRCYWSGKCLPVKQDKNNFPPNIVSAIKAKDNNWYYFNKKGQYCERPDEDTEECNKWKDSKSIFGCQEKDIKQELKFLCNNTKIKAGAIYETYVYIFRGGKYWKFDNKPKPNKPFGDFVEGQVPAKTKWPGIHFPGGASSENDNFIMVYKAKWSRWKPLKPDDDNPYGDDYDGMNLGPDDDREQTPVKSESKGKPNNNGDDEENPKPGDYSDQNPSDNDSNDGKPNKENEGNDIGDDVNAKPGDNNGDNPDDDDSNGGKPNKNGTKGNKPYKGNKGNNNGDNENPKPGDDTGDNSSDNPDDSDSNDGKPNKNGNKGNKLNSNGNSKNPDNENDDGINDVNDEPIREEGDDTPDENDGKDSDAGALIPIDLEKGKFAKVVDDKVCNIVIKDNKCYWSGDCKPVKEDENNFPPNIIAAIKDNNRNWHYFDKNGSYCKRKENDFNDCIEWKDNRELFGCNNRVLRPDLESLCFNTKIKAGTQEPDRIPGESDGSNPYIYVFRGGKYWKFDNKPSNKKPFGDLIVGSKNADEKWPGVHFPGGAGFENSSFIMIYKGKWSRWTPNGGGPDDNQPTDETGLQPTDSSGKGMRPTKSGGKGSKPSGSKGDEEPGSDDNALELIGNDIKPDDNALEPTGSDSRPADSDQKGDQPVKDVFEQPIEEEDEVKKPEYVLAGPDALQKDLENGGGALITINPKIGKYAKVSGDMVCYFVIKDKKCFKSGMCSYVNEDKNNFPPNIMAAIKARDNNWYFLNNKGKYCKRPDKNTDECTEWKDNKEVFGCFTRNLNPKLKALCVTPDVNAGSNYPPDIYVFKDGKFWRFDNKFKPKKPFGDLIEGEIPAKKKWPGIHFPGGTSFEKTNFVIIYKTKWSRWRPAMPGEDPYNPNNPNDDTALEPIESGDKGRPTGSDSDDGSDGTQLEPIQSSSGRVKPTKKGSNGKPSGSDSGDQPNGVYDGSDDSQLEPTHGKPPKSGDKGIKPEVNEVSDEPIRDEEGEAPDEPDRNPGDAGALIPIDANKGKFAKVSDDNVCYLTIKNNTASWDGKCKPVAEDENKFPPNIMAFVKPKDKQNYFFDKEGKHCKRPDKSTEECTEWKDNSVLFGCNPEEQEPKPELQSLCNNPVIKAGTDHKQKIYVFRGGKQWIFNNKPKPNKPFGDLIEGGKPAKYNWTGIHFPGGAGSSKGKLIMIYKKRWSQWTIENTKGSGEPSAGDVSDEPIQEPEEEEEDNEIDVGALIIVDELKGKYAKIKTDTVCYLIVKDNKAFWDGRCVSVTEDDNKYPPNILTAIQSKDKNWYFFNREGKHCKRPEKDKNECTEWKDNQEILGCNEKDQKPEQEALCKNPKIKAGSNIPPFIYIFRGGKYWKFNNKPKGNKPFGDIVEGDLPADNRWPGIHFPGGSSHNKAAFMMVYRNKWAQWKPNDDPKSKLKDVSDEPIREGDDILEEPQGDDQDSGALINIDDSKGKFAKIKGNQICYLTIKNNKCYWDEKCKPVTEDPNKYPANSIAAIKGRDKMWYYFDREGKYCKRAEKDKTECTEWKDNKEVFGCDDKDIKPELESLCSKTKIKAGGNVPPHIYILRGGKYWKFDNKPKPNKPFGDVMEGGVKANTKWQGIHISGGSSYYKTSFIMVYKNKWSLWKTTGGSDSNDVFDEPIMDKEVIKDEDEDDSDSGALISIDIKTGKYAKIKGDQVCYLIISNNKCNWIGKCVPVRDDENKFPPNTWGAVKARDKNWYYFDNNGKYCKRADNAKNQCNEWNDNKDLFGCNAERLKPELETLCNNPKIKAGSNYPPFIYIFRGKNYWKFDNSPKPDKPFGELLEGDKPAGNIWTGIHLPGGSGYNKLAFIIVYKNKWSQWKPADNGLTSSETDVNDEPIGEIQEEIPDEPDGDDSDGGALIVSNEKKGKYAKIKGNQICYYYVKDNKCSTIGNCSAVKDDENKFPPNIVAVIRDRDKNWLFFNKDGKYCERADNVKTDCKQWKDNGEIFGCKVKDIKPNLQSLCKNTKINSGTNFSPYIYVFRGGKYWKFNNKPKANKPIGDLVEGGLFAKEKWPGIHFPGGSGYNKLSFVMIYDNKWSSWKSGTGSSGNQVIDEAIGGTKGMSAEEVDVIMKASYEEEDEILRESPDDFALSPE